MGQKQKLFEDIVTAMEWMSKENFREFVAMMTDDHPEITARLQKEITRAERKLLTNNTISVTVTAQR